MSESVPVEGRATIRSLWPVIVAGCIAVVIVAAGGSMISRATNLPYEYSALVSIVVYATIGIFAARRGSLASSAWAGLAVSLFDATVGWWISWQIGPGRVPVSKWSDILLVVLSLKFVLAGSTLIAIAAGAIWLRSNRATSDIQRP